MTRKQKIFVAVLAGALGLNLLVGYSVFSREAKKAGVDQGFEKIRVMMQVLQLIRQDYVDERKVQYKTLIYNAIRGMVAGLDPFSSFMPPDAYKNMMESTEGEFGGIGVVVTIRDGYLTVVAPMEGTPGSRAGIRAEDRIIAINGESAKGIDMQEALKRMKGKPGTVVNLTIERPSTGETRKLRIVREVIQVRSVKDAKVLPGGIGYLRITQFNEPTARRLKKALKKLYAKKIHGLVLDLRNNPGGLLDAAVGVCSLFLPPKKLVVFTQGRRPSQRRDYYTDGSGAGFPTLPMAILVNRGSASAAEITSGCLQDYHRAVLVGERTFGKGTVQNIIELPDHSALRLTVAKYYTPSKRVIHKHGIKPDIVVRLSETEEEKLAEYQAAIGEKAKRAVGFHDRQLQRAVETLRSYQAYLDAAKHHFSKARTAAAAPGKPAPVR